MALYEITLNSTFVGQKCVNRWNYETTSVPAAVTNSFALASAFGGIVDGGLFPDGSLMESLQSASSVGVQFADILVRNVYDPVDFYQTPIIVNGSVTGEALPPTSAFGFYTNRTRLDIRRGFKRFVGIAESAQNSGTLTSGFLTNVGVLAGSMSVPLVYNDEGTDLTFNPVIVQKMPVAPTPENGHKGVVYEYYPTLVEQATHLMRSIVWTPYTTVRTQTSRQFGRGQ